MRWPLTPNATTVQDHLTGWKRLDVSTSSRVETAGHDAAVGWEIGRRVKNESGPEAGPAPYSSLDDGFNQPDERPKVGDVRPEFSFCVLNALAWRLPAVLGEKKQTWQAVQMVGWTTFAAGQDETSVIISTILRVLPQQAIFGQVILEQAMALGADVWMPACQDRRPRAASDEVVVDVTASSPTDRGSGNANIKEKSEIRSAGEQGCGPTCYRCNNGRCNSLLQLQLCLSRQDLGIVHEPLASICTSRDLLRNTPGADHSNIEKPQI
ncbi:hypothetical protein LA080_005671 [Diaporthe eres]|nr:hypothetical protein LA080_005671 [Diaporthe eres]